MNKNNLYVVKFSLITMALISIFTNCMPSGFVTIQDQSPEETTPALLVNNPTTPVTLNLMSANQLFQSLLNLNELSDDNNTIRNEFNVRRSAFTDIGSHTGINAPYLLSLTSLSGAICHESITQRKGIFQQLDLTTPIAQLTDATYLANANQLFSRVTSREMDQEERNLFLTFKNEFLTSGQTDDAAQHRQLWVSTCSAIMSHLKTITY